MSSVQESDESQTIMKIVQINLNHCQTAQDILTQMAIDEGADVVLISEPYKIPESSTWICDKAKQAAIWTSGKHAFQETDGKSEGFVRARINGINFYSCYARPSLTATEYQTMLDNIAADAHPRNSVVIGGDFNAWATEWGSKRTNARGRMLLESFAALDVTIANEGRVDTYRKAGTGSIIDITFVSNSLVRTTKWRVSEEYTHSDHQAVIFTIEERKVAQSPRLTGPKWKDSLFDKETFEYTMSTFDLGQGSAETLSHRLIQFVTTACDAAMPRRVPSRRGSPCYWWNDEIGALRTRCLQARRLVQRSRGSPDFQERLFAFKCLRRDLKKEIKESKTRCFKRLCDDADINPWGTAYRMVMSKLKGKKSPQITCPTMLKSIVETLFPQRKNTLFDAIGETDEEDIPQITEDELLAACRKICDNKAPGPDGIPNKALKAAVFKRPDMFIATMQQCLKEGFFAVQWKRQHLVLLPKGNKSHGAPTSYRPICLLDTMGKILERIIYNRLLAIAEKNGTLSDLQFGFRRGRSTVDAIKVVVDTAAAAIQGERWRWGTKEYCAVVTLDVRNAFNTAGWSHIRRSLARMDAPRYVRKIVLNYFTNRRLEYHTDEGVKYYHVSAGVPQGSVLGPLLWNIMYDGVLRLALPRGVKVIGFADDIAVVTVAKHIHEVETATNKAILTIRNWLETAGLELADHKTEAVLITGRKSLEYISIRAGRQIIASKDAIKYLGVVIDNRLQFKAHVEYTKNKASLLQAALSRILPNIGGPKYARRILLSRVVSSVLLYAAPVWAAALTTKEIRRNLCSSYRLSALRVISGFRTVSDDAALVMAGMLPVDILADEMRRIFLRRTPNKQELKRIKEEERAISMVRWQTRWENTTKGRWTHKLIPVIETWVNRSHGNCSFQLTQFLSGHGGYRKYLHRFGHDDSPACPTCPEQEEDTEHAIFYCNRFTEWRPDIPSVHLLVEYMLRSEDEWQNIFTFVSKVQKELRTAESTRRKAITNARMTA